MNLNPPSNYLFKYVTVVHSTELVSVVFDEILAHRRISGCWNTPSMSQYVDLPRFECAHFHRNDGVKDSAGKISAVPLWESEAGGVEKFLPDGEYSNVQFGHRVVKDFRVFLSNVFDSNAQLHDGRFYFFVGGCFEISILHLICLKRLRCL
jgi:hypothetical protein